MATIVVFGGTGYTGSNIVREAASRGHQVASVSRSAPSDPVEGVHYEIGSAEALAPRVIPGADAVVATLSPRGDMAGRLVEVYGGLLGSRPKRVPATCRSAGSAPLRPAPGQPRFVEGEVPEQFRDEALEGEASRIMLVEEAPADLDWVFVSPAGSYGAWAAGERTGTYRVGGEVALFDADGGSTISGGDFAAAIVDEIQSPAYHRAHIGVAY